MTLSSAVWATASGDGILNRWLFAGGDRQVRDVMVFGDSGILACTPPDRRPEWEATKKRLVWPNGATATAYSAHDPESLRGPQFDAAWADELAKWKKAEVAWDMLQFALRLGPNPQAVVTTTPRPVPLLKRLMADEATRLTRMATSARPGGHRRMPRKSTVSCGFCR